MATRVVGLDIGSRHVRAVVFEAKLRSFYLLEMIEERIVEPEVVVDTDDEGTHDASPDTEAPVDAHDGDGPHDTSSASGLPPVEKRAWTPGVSDAVARILARPGFEDIAVICAAPEGSFFTTAIELPFQGDREIRAVLGPQLDGRLPEDVDELHLDYMVSGKVPDGAWRIYAGGTPREQMALLAEAWEAAGADPRIVDVMPFPLYTAGEWLEPSTNRTVAYVDVGAKYTRIVVAHNGHIEIARTIPGGGESVTEALAEAFAIDETLAREGKHREAALFPHDDTSERTDDQRRADEACRIALRATTRDLRRTLAAHAATEGRNVEHVYLSGGGAALRGLDTYFAEQLGVPTSTLTFQREELATIPNSAAVGHRFITALGLALRGYTPDRASTFNLRHGAWAFRGAYEYITQRLPALAMMVGSLLVAFFFFIGARNSLLKAEFRATDNALGELSRQVFGAEIRDPSMVRARLARGVDGAGLHPDVSAYDMVVRISKAAQVTVDNQMPMELTGIDVDMSRRQVKVSGVCDSANTAETFGRNLGKDSCMRGVQRTNLNQRRSDSRFEFTFSGTVNCQPQANAAVDDDADADNVAPADASEITEEEDP